VLNHNEDLCRKPPTRSRELTLSRLAVSLPLSLSLFLRSPSCQLPYTLRCPTPTPPACDPSSSRHHLHRLRTRLRNNRVVLRATLLHIHTTVVRRQSKEKRRRVVLFGMGKRKSRKTKPAANSHRFHRFSGPVDEGVYSLSESGIHRRYRRGIRGYLRVNSRYLGGSYERNEKAQDVVQGWDLIIGIQSAVICAMLRPFARSHRAASLHAF